MKSSKSLVRRLSNKAKVILYSFFLVSFCLAGCANPADIREPDAMTALALYLDGFDKNDKENPVSLPPVMLKSIDEWEDMLGVIALKGKYVHVDISGSTGFELFAPEAMQTGGNLIVSLILPNTMTGIGNNAFTHFVHLTSVTIPNSVTSIGSFVFNNCSGLTSVTIPDSVNSIRYNAFSGCTGLTSVTIPNNVTLIDSSAFSGCTGLTRVFYGGINSTAWNRITISSENSSLTSATRYYFSATKPDTTGTHWRWVEENPTVWE